MDSSRPFKFLDLPAELRNDIYAFALQGEGPFRRIQGPPTCLRLEARPIPALGLILACKQTYAEGHALVYGQSTFRLDIFSNEPWRDELEESHLDVCEASEFAEFHNHWPFWSKIRFLHVNSWGPLREERGMRILKNLQLAGVTITAFVSRLVNSSTALEAVRAYGDIKVRGQIIFNLTLIQGEDKKVVEETLEAILNQMSDNGSCTRSLFWGKAGPNQPEPGTVTCVQQELVLSKWTKVRFVGSEAASLETEL